MKKIIKNIDKPLLVVTIILFIIGLIMVFSSSNVTAYMSHEVSPYNYFFKQGIFLTVGLVMALIMIRFNTKAYGVFSWTLLIVFSALLVILLFVGKAKNQAVSWFDFGFFSLQPSEFIKVIFIVWMARYYDVNKNKLDTYKRALFPIVIAVVVAGLIFIQPDLGTTIIFGLIVALLFFAVPIPSKIKFNTVAVGVGGIILVAFVLVMSGKTIMLERQLERLNFTNPCDRLLDSGSQVCNGYIAINNGGLTGVGLGNSTQKYLYLPEPYTDFIFAIIMEEIGLISGIAIILAYMFIIYRIIVIGKRSRTNSSALMCYGVAIYIFLHITVNLMGLFGLMPMTGVPLPFMSYGGSFTICLIAALTIVQRVSVETGIRKELKK